MRPFPLSHRPQSRGGAVTPLTILSLALLVGVAALVIDAGTLMEARRHVQAAADAAALAGADDLYTNYLTNQGKDTGRSAQDAAVSCASANGYSNDGAQSTVTVNTSGANYKSGPNAGQTIPPGYIEVVIQYNAPHLFSGVFGAGSSPISARAVARGQFASAGPFNGLTALNLNSNGALSIGNLASLTVKGGILVNSSSGLAINASLTAQVATTQLTVNPSLLLNILSILPNLLGIGGSSPSVVGSLPEPDPLRFLPAPSTTGLTVNSNVAITSGKKDLYPGVYKNGIVISGLTTNVTLHDGGSGSPGVYYLQGLNGLQVTEWASVQTASGETGGIMIYNDWNDGTDSFSVTTFGSVALIPPSSGIYRGLLYFQKPGTSTTSGPPLTFSANGAAIVRGTLYASHAQASLSSLLATNVLGGQVIADTVNANGNVTIDPGTQPTASSRILGLVQ